MSIRNKFTVTVGSLALIAGFNVAGHAQQAVDGGKVSTQNQVRGERRGGRRHHGMSAFRILRTLNLTDAQHQQARTIIDKFKTSIQPQRQALKDLHMQFEQGTLSDEAKAKARTTRDEIRAAAKGTHGELLAILTPEQRTQYDQMEQQFKIRREERRARRSERKMRQSTPAQPSVKDVQ